MSYKNLIDLLNENDGVLSLIIFILTLVIGWLSGILSALARKPKLKIRIIPKMTFCSVYLVGEKYTPPGQGTYDLHKTAFAAYLSITNVGNAPTEVGKIKIGYYKDNGKRTWFQKRIWIEETNILGDFSIPMGDGQVMMIPHIHQDSLVVNKNQGSYLQIGQSQVGVSYFEQPSSWGNYYPRYNEKLKTNICIKVEDSFGKTYRSKSIIPFKKFEDALRYNPRFGLTYHLFDKDKIQEITTSKKQISDKGGEQ